MEQKIKDTFFGIIAGFKKYAAKRRKYRSSLVMTTFFVSVMAGVIWLTSMYCLTAMEAESAANEFIDNYSHQASRISGNCFGDLEEENMQNITNRDITNLAKLTELLARYSAEGNRRNVTNKKKNESEYQFWSAVESGGYSFGAYKYPPAQTMFGNNGFITRAGGNPVEEYAATAIYDAQGNCLEKSWDDFFCFEYYTKEQWEKKEESSGYTRVFFDRAYFREDIQETLENEGVIYSEDHCKHFENHLDRFLYYWSGGCDCATSEYVPVGIVCSGTFEGDEFIPYEIDYLVEDDGEPFRVCIYKVDIFPEETELTEIYAEMKYPCRYVDSPSFSYDGRKYDGIKNLVEELGPTRKDSTYDEETGTYNANFLPRYEGLNVILTDVSYCFEKDGETYFVGESYNNSNAGELQFYIVNAILFSHWKAAFWNLRYTYLTTLMITIGLVLLLRHIFKRQLIRPMQMVNMALQDDREWLRNFKDKPWKWKEGHLLEQAYAAHVTKGKQRIEELAKQQDEITRLTTALDYANEAEENRRRMTSDIAHELKTPLAVIHSYSEGLKERIAEEKRDKYLDVILSETERMDAMVLEMLDLSRLEAGRVKISRVEFSLADMAKEVFDKLELAIEAKNLHVEYHFPEDSMVNADELRIGQVIENFATNAVKYTPVNGTIRVIIRSGQVDRTFAIENDSEPLHQEALDKVWDTFYRADESRSSKGTGLGLAIAKSIVELHGGRCYAKNTDNGVEFGFIL